MQSYSLWVKRVQWKGYILIYQKISINIQCRLYEENIWISSLSHKKKKKNPQNEVDHLEEHQCERNDFQEQLCDLDVFSIN